MKRTNLVLDEHLLEEAVKLSGERTYSGAVSVPWRTTIATTT